jgi:hypothetical protein
MLNAPLGNRRARIVVAGMLDADGFVIVLDHIGSGRTVIGSNTAQMTYFVRNESL